MPIVLEDPKVDWSNSTNLHHSRWKLSDDVSGPAIAFFVSLEFLLSLPSNMFIVLHSLFHYKKSFSNASTIFLFNFALSDLIVTIFYMPLLSVSASAGEWIFGSSDHMRDILCQVHGFVLMFTAAVSVDLLTILSIDRFLYIVKANSYHKIMTLKVAIILVIATWVFGAILNLTPYYSQDISAYNWSGIVGGCGPVSGKGDVHLLIVINAHLSIVVIIIIITSIWTLLYSYGFMKKTLRRQKTHLSLENFDIQKSLYTKKVKNLFGIFGALLLTNAIFWLPVIVSNLLSIVYVLPPEIEITNLILYLFNSVSNPIVQIYFRKDLCDSVNTMFETIRFWISYIICFKKRSHLIISRQISQSQAKAPFSRSNSMASSRYGQRAHNSIGRQNTLKKSLSCLPASNGQLYSKT